MNRISSKRGFAPRPANPAPFGRIPLLAACLLALLGLVQNALAHDHPGYSHDPQVKTHNPHWMSRLPDGVRMRQLSVPGTHDTMALHGGKVGNLAITQTMSLANQLESGIRAFDFRVGQIGDKFFLFHGFVDQDAELGQDVLGVMLNFLRANPGEALFMRLKWECYDPTPILEGKEKRTSFIATTRAL